MTDEEKAEYLESLFQKVCDNVDCSKESDCTTCRIKVVKGIELGFAEGRKEKYEMALSQIKRDREKVIEYNEELVKKNAELKVQIEKMKNVGNCKHAMTCANWNEKQTMLGCMKFCKNCKEWELAE